MNQNFFILVLCLLLLAGTALSNAARDENAYIGYWRKDPVRWPDTIDIDSEQGDSYEDGGSADDYFSGIDDDEDGPLVDDDDDDDDIEARGSGSHKGACLLVQRQIEEENPIGYYIPECTDNGEWKPRQCHYRQGVCWCVTDEGTRIPGTKQKFSAELICGTGRSDDEPSVVTRPRPRATPETRQPDPEDEVEFDDSQEEDRSKFPTPNDEDGNEPGDTDRNTGDDFREEKPKRVSLIMQPGILAGIIGGAVVGLLCTVLLMMFIVYRMRKKDEGSYALDDPKQKARDREFFA